MLQRLKTSLRSESGNFMVTSMVGALVMLIVVGAVAAGVLGIGLFQKAITDRSDLTKEAAMADSLLRSDILWASTITATDKHRVELTVPGQNGRCRVATWTVVSAPGGATDVNVSVVNYPSFDAASNPVRCSGTGSEPTTQTIISDAAPDSAFSYANPGGRPLTYTAGTASLAGDATAPADVDAKAWASPRLAAVALDTAVASTTERRAAYRFAQTADNLSVIKEAPDAPTHFVPEGNLTAAR